MQRCCNAAIQCRLLNWVSFFSSTGETVYVDNCANTYISNNRANFLTFRDFDQSEQQAMCVATVSVSSLPAGKGTVCWSWCDDDCREHTFDLPHCRYYPESPACILSPSQLGIYPDIHDLGTGTNSSVHSSCFYWNRKKFSCTIPHSASFMP